MRRSPSAFQHGAVENGEEVAGGATEPCTNLNADVSRIRRGPDWLLIVFRDHPLGAPSRSSAASRPSAAARRPARWSGNRHGLGVPEESRPARATGPGSAREAACAPAGKRCGCRAEGAESRMQRARRRGRPRPGHKAVRSLRHRRVCARDIHLEQTRKPCPVGSFVCATQQLPGTDAVLQQASTFAFGCDSCGRPRVEALHLLPPDDRLIRTATRTSPRGDAPMATPRRRRGDARSVARIPRRSAAGLRARRGSQRPSS
jgi:hypothetical protein